MKKILLKSGLALTLFMASINGNAQSMYGLTASNEIWTMANVNTPGNVSGPYAINGVISGQALVALDTRSSNGMLYALGYDSTSGAAQLYTITGSGSSYTAKAVGSSLTTLSFGGYRSFGFDFIATLDNQIRVTGTNGNSYILNADNGTVISSSVTSMTYASGDTHSGATAALAATSYTNNYYGADATEQYGYDLTTGILVKFDNANYYNNTNNYPQTVHSIGLTSGLLLNAASGVGMDNWFDTATHSNTIWLTATTMLSSGAHLYKMDKTTGLATDMGAIGSGSLNVRDIAFQSYRDSSMANSSIQGSLMAALTLNNRNIVFFDSYRPSYIRKVVQLYGMASGQAMLAIAYGFNNKLYGMGYNGTNQTYQLYTIDSATGNVTAVNSSAGTLNLGSGNSSLGNQSNTHIGFNFIGNTTDRIRVIGNNGNTNVQLSATTGAIVATDSSLHYQSGDANYGTSVNLSSIGYLNSYSGSTSSTMVGYDVSTGAMVSLNGNGNGNSGMLSTSFDLNSVLNLFNNSYRNGYIDVNYDMTTHQNTAFMVGNYYGDSSREDNYSTMYTANNYNGTGTMTPQGQIGGGTPVKSLSSLKRVGPTGIYTIPTGYNNALLVYPNPATSITHIVLPTTATGKVLVDVIDLNGRVWIQNTYGAGINQLDVNVGNLPTGMYSIRLTSTGMAQQNLKLVKQ